MMRTWTGALLLGSVMMLTACSNSPPVANRPHLRVPRSELAPLVTAELTDPAWAQAAVITHLVPSLGAQAADPRFAPADRTEVRVLWRPEALYVRFLCRDDEVFTPFDQTRDANHYLGDVAEIFIDPLGDQRQWIEVQLSPRGGILDLQTLATAPLVWDRDGKMLPRVSRREVWVDRAWNYPDLRTAAGPWMEQGAPRGWIADFALPAPALLRRLQLTELQPMTLRANFLRYDGPMDPTTGQRATLIARNWATVIHGCPHLSPAAMGYLILLP